MLLPILFPYIKFSLGTLYPAYKTWKALKRKDETTRRRWMKYWVSFAAFQSFEFVSDITLAFILPFYIEIKLIALMWLVHGTKLVYDSIVNRELAKREKSIDKWLTRINKVRNELIALMWFEISRCSVRIITSLMSGGLSILAKSPDSNDDNCSNETTSPTPPPMNSEDDDNNNNKGESRTPSRRSCRLVNSRLEDNEVTDIQDMETDGDQETDQDVTRQYAIPN